MELIKINVIKAQIHMDLIRLNGLKLHAISNISHYHTVPIDSILLDFNSNVNNSFTTGFDLHIFYLFIEYKISGELI